MDNLPRDAYLVGQVMTASPQKLHLMLIEGVTRLIHKARQHWSRQEDDQAGEALIRAQEVVGEILAGFKRDMDPDLVKQVAAVYAFVLRSLVEGTMLHDERRLADALKILDIERETWRQLCQQIGAEQPGFSVSSPPPAPSIPTGIFNALPAGEQPGRFSLEA